MRRRAINRSNRRDRLKASRAHLVAKKVIQRRKPNKRKMEPQMRRIPLKNSKLRKARAQMKNKKSLIKRLVRIRGRILRTQKTQTSFSNSMRNMGGSMC